MVRALVQSCNLDAGPARTFQLRHCAPSSASVVGRLDHLYNPVREPAELARRAK